jgi:hypothetical protein
MTDKTKILCFLDNDCGRDVEILIPVIYFAEKHLNCVVDFAFIWDIHTIYQKKPDIVLIANTIGSKLHHLIAKYAYDNNIKVFALISEGNFRTDGSFNYWGYNTEKMYYQDFICHWSNRTLDFLAKRLPEYKSRMVLTGASGFDRYKMYKFISKQDFLKNKGLEKYKKVIGYAGWTFGRIYNKNGLNEIIEKFKDKADAYIVWMKEQMGLIEDILKDTIKNNPDILFILKRHPSEMHPHLVQKDKNEMINFVEYPNVLYIRNEEDVHSLISVSDIWLSFESTTVIDAWLMKNIPTIYINPDIHFDRNSNYKGTAIAKSYLQLQSYLDEFFSTGIVYNFEKNRKERAKIISQTIGYSDGLNHLRAGFYLKKTIAAIPTKKVKVKLNLRYFIMYILLHVGQVFYNKKIFIKLPKFKKTVWLFERFKLKKFWILKEKYYRYLDEFYKKNSFNEKIKQNKFWEKLINEKF